MKGAQEIKARKIMIKIRISYPIRLDWSLILQKVELHDMLLPLLRWPPSIIHPPSMISRAKGVNKYSLHLMS